MKWELISLREVIEFKGGGTPRKDVPEFWNGDIPWATVKDFKSLELKMTEDSISEYGLKQSASNLIPAGHVIIPTRMGLGKAAINSIDLAINQDLRALIPIRDLDPRYLLHCMIGLGPEIERNGSGATVKGITQEKLYNLKIPLPPLEEQKRIAKILDAADALRAKRRQAIAQLDTFLQSTFLDLFGDPVTNSKDWDDTKKLGEVADIVSGITKGRKTNGNELFEVPYMAVANVQDRHIKLNPLKTISATETEIARYELKKNDLLLTEGGDPDKLGRGSLWNEPYLQCIHQNHVFRVRLIQGNISPVFLNFIVGSQRGKRYFLKSSKQTTGIASINMTQLKKFPLLNPPIELQQRFTSIVESVEQQKSKMQAHLDQLDTLFASLQQRSFKGEL